VALGDELKIGGSSVTKTIILPLDRSLLSERAIACAEGLGRALPARVVLVRGLLLGSFSPNHPFPPDELQEARNELAEAAARLGNAGVEADWFVINDEAGWAIIRAAVEQAADLVVMATHARGPLERSFLGSVADRVVRDGPAPVLLLPPAVTVKWPAEPRHLRIVVPLDGSPLAERATGPAAEIAKATNGEIILTGAIDPPLLSVKEVDAHFPPEASPSTELQRWSLLPVADRLASSGVRVACEELVGKPAEVILGVARAKKAHLIAMATHGRSGPSRLVLGSVADAVLRRTHLPVLLCGPHASVASGAVVTGSHQPATPAQPVVDPAPQT
jgi:nucleotide-binding universal stress UspA family protein